MALRDAIKDRHDKAEKHRFVVLLLSGRLPEDAYAEYLFNQAMCYLALEQEADRHGLLADIPGIRRAALIEQDAEELNRHARVHPSTRDYVQYVGTLSPELLWAHIYARHFADMYGGQMLKKVVPGSGRMYEFEDRAELIAKVREKLSDGLADEANRVLDFALALFDEIAEAYGLATEANHV
jgi:heme oxygenase